LGIKKEKKEEKGGKRVECIAIGLRHLSVRRHKKKKKNEPVCCDGLVLARLEGLSPPPVKLGFLSIPRPRPHPGCMGCLRKLLTGRVGGEPGITIIPGW